jgi:hypothetical protein
MFGSGIRPLEQPGHLGRQGRQVGARDHDIAVRLYPGKDGKGFFRDRQQPAEVAGGVERATRRIREVIVSQRNSAVTSMVPTMLAFSTARSSAGIQYSKMVWPPTWCTS